MKKIVLTFVVTLGLVSKSIGSDIGALRWDQSNIGTLRSLDAGAVVSMVNEQQPGLVKTTEVDEIGWVDPTGTGQFKLVMKLSGPCAHYVAIYSRTPREG